MVEAVSTVAEIREGVRTAGRVHVRGGGSKPALSTSCRASDALSLDLSRLNGVVDYQADEYTFTARAGTPVADVEAMLAERGQYLPFDPPFAARGATLGGTVAAGLSGSGRYRYGGVRDFLIGMRFVDGQGQEVRGGGTVVKNAAGFDFPKLFVGSLGRLGVLTELTFKVFPQPPAYATVTANFDSLADLLSALHVVTGGQSIFMRSTLGHRTMSGHSGFASAGWTQRWYSGYRHCGPWCLRARTHRAV